MSDFDGVGPLSGTITPVALIEQGGAPNKVIDSGQAFNVKVDWTVTPPASAVLLDGTWTVRAYAESVGPGPEILIGQLAVAGTGGPSYTATITVPAGTLASNAVPANDSGVYNLVVVLTYRTALGVQTEIAAFSEGPTFLIREP